MNLSPDCNISGHSTNALTEAYTIKKPMYSCEPITVQ